MFIYVYIQYFGLKQKQDQYQSENYGSADKVIPLLC